MKEILQYYATCNQVVNQTMIQLVSGRIKDPMDYALEGYFFKSLGQLLEHVWVSDAIWMNSFLALTDYGLSINEATERLPVHGEKYFADFESYRQARAKMDALICRFAGSFRDEDRAKTVSRTMRNGEKMEKVLWKALIHFFNHQTHHRGQIANILDELQIENNFSNMIFLD